ncbi:MAG: hypothetical protein AB1609_15160 [Bacillota bacterium]
MTGNPTNLFRLKSFRDDDILATPCLPEYGKVSLRIVDRDYPSSYEYRKGGRYHLSHVFRIKRSCGLDGSVSERNERLATWYGTLGWLRLPFLPFPDLESDFRALIEELERHPGKLLEPSRPDEYMWRLRRDPLAKLKAELCAITPSHGDLSFEAVCERLVSVSGYRAVGRHQYDTAGGDDGIRFVRERRSAFPCEFGETVLLVRSRSTTASRTTRPFRLFAAEAGADTSAWTTAPRVY